MREWRFAGKSFGNILVNENKFFVTWKLDKRVPHWLAKGKREVSEE
jgi:hypothetical protein